VHGMVPSQSTVPPHSTAMSYRETLAVGVLFHARAINVDSMHKRTDSHAS
jgi:hypothetical protein